MKTITKISFLLFLLAFCSGYAQKFEIQKVTVADLQEKRHPKDTSAAAAVVYKIGETFFDYNQHTGFTVRTKVKTRIKIFKKEGYGWADHSQSYYIDANLKEAVNYSNAYTYNLVGGKVEKTKLKGDGEFDEKINKYWNRKKITMPNVKEGSIIEFEYTISSPRDGAFEDWDFQTSIPVGYSEYMIAVPEYYTYKATHKGYIMPKITTEKVTRSLFLTSKEDAGNRLTRQNVISTDKFDYQEIRTLYFAKELPALKDEAFVNNIKNYTASVSHELSKVQWPNSTPKFYSSDWESVTKTIYEADSFGGELNKTGYFESDVNALIAGVTDPAQKINLIFNHVKKSVKWNDFAGYSCEDGVRSAYKGKTGNVAEINLMLTAMLRHAGLNANPVLLSTRSNGIAVYPSRAAFNYVVACVESESGPILLDATEKYSLPNVLPRRDLNWVGRLMRKDGTSEQIDLMPQKPSKEAVNVMYAVDSQGSIDGKLRKQVSDHYALSFRQRAVGQKSEQYLENLENENDKIEIADYVRENETDLSQPIVESYNFKAANVHEIIGDKMYISPLLFLTTSTNPFKQDVREYPVDFSFPTESKYNVSIEIPQGYVIESLPQPINLGTEGKLANFKYNVVGNGNKIQVSVTESINQAIIAPVSYSAIKDFFQKMVDKENEKIVLKKI